MSKPLTRMQLARRRLIDMAAVVILLAMASCALWPTYSHIAIVWLCAVAIMVGTAIAIIGATWPPYATMGLTVTTFVLIGVPLAIPDQALAVVLPTGTGLRSLVEGSVNGWRRMLTVQTPLGTYENLMVPPLIAVLVASVLAVTVALRAKRPGWAIIPPVGVLVFAISFGAAETRWALGIGAGLVAVALLWATLRTDPIRTPSGFAKAKQTISATTIRRYLAALGLVAVCAAGSMSVTHAITAPEDRTVLRDLTEPPLDIADLRSPLIGYRNAVNPPGANQDLFTVDGLAPQTRIRLATLDEYNGQVFAVGTDPLSGTFERLPYRIERDDGATPTSIRLTIASLSGPWLPTVGELVSISFDSSSVADGFYYNTTSNSASIVGGLTPTSYTIDTIVTPMPDAESLATAQPAPISTRSTAHIPEEVAQAAQEHGVGDTPGERLISLTQWLQEGFVSHSDTEAGEPFSRPGHSAERLRIFVTEAQMIGDAEQYATAMALLAREVGFPSRVVVGYAPEEGQTKIRGTDTTAWVEVQLANGTWVGLDPNPTPREIPPTQQQETRSVSEPQSVLPPPPALDDDPQSERDEDADPQDDPSAAPGWQEMLLLVATVAGITIGILGFITLPIWLVGLLVRVRRARRRRQDQRRVSVAGAWSEIRDALIDRGYQIPDAATRQEVAALCESDQIMTLAQHADYGTFSTHALSASDVVNYWSQLKAARQSLDTDVTFPHKVRRIVTVQAARSLRQSWAHQRKTRVKGRS